MKNIIALSILFYSCLTAFSQGNYIQYHQYINQAETHFFIHQNADSAFYYYDKAMSNFEFVFVDDMVNAAQLAHYSDRPYLKYLIRGFRYGLKLKHLEQIPMFGTDCVLDSILYPNDSLQLIYQTQRQAYLQDIDTNYLNWIYDLALQDQVDKRKPYAEYDLILERNLKTLQQLIHTRGFPSNRTIGIDDRAIFTEMGMPDLDFSVRKQQQKFAKAHYYDADENSLGSSYIMVFLVHHDCSYVKIGDLLLKEMKKGHIHPREIGLIYDNMYRYLAHNRPNRYCMAEGALDGVYYLNPFLDYSTIEFSKMKTDKKRKALYIVPLAVDKAKLDFQKREGAKLFWGFWDSL